jgi:hypothetical protein
VESRNALTSEAVALGLNLTRLPRFLFLLVPEVGQFGDELDLGGELHRFLVLPLQIQLHEFAGVVETRKVLKESLRVGGKVLPLIFR